MEDVRKAYLVSKEYTHDNGNDSFLLPKEVFMTREDADKYVSEIIETVRRRGHRVDGNTYVRFEGQYVELIVTEINLHI